MTHLLVFIAVAMIVLSVLELCVVEGFLSIPAVVALFRKRGF